MGALVPVLTQAAIGGAVGLAGKQISRNQQNKSNQQALKQLQEQQRLQEQQAAQDAALDRQKIATDARQDEEERKAALRRAVARQRANFAGQGVSSSGGSSGAVLLGLFEETEDEARRREELDQIRFTSINQNLDQRSAVNILQRTQLKERNDLARSANDKRRDLDIFKEVRGIF